MLAVIACTPPNPPFETAGRARGHVPRARAATRALPLPLCMPPLFPLHEHRNAPARNHCVHSTLRACVFVCVCICPTPHDHRPCMVLCLHASARVCTARACNGRRSCNSCSRTPVQQRGVIEQKCIQGGGTHPHTSPAADTPRAHVPPHRARQTHQHTRAVAAAARDDDTPSPQKGSQKPRARPGSRFRHGGRQVVGLLARCMFGLHCHIPRPPLPPPPLLRGALVTAVS